MMINREMIMEELENRGYEVEVFDKVSNGVVLNGIMVRRGNVNPVVYVNSFIEEAADCDLSLEEVVDKVEDVLHTETPEVNVDKLREPDFILKNVYIGIQKESGEDLIKRETEYEGIESYLYVRISDEASFKLHKTNLEMMEMKEEDVWKSAEENTTKDFVISTMRDVLKEMMPDEDEEMFLEVPYVITNKSRFRGASSILAKEKIREFLRGRGYTKFAMLPSSIHEVLLMPMESEDELEGLSEMVREINHTQVEEEERLTDRAYVFKF